MIFTSLFQIIIYDVRRLASIARFECGFALVPAVGRRSAAEAGTDPRLRAARTATGVAGRRFPRVFSMRPNWERATEPLVSDDPRRRPGDFMNPRKKLRVAFVVDQASDPSS